MKTATMLAAFTMLVTSGAQAQSVAAPVAPVQVQLETQGLGASVKPLVAAGVGVAVLAGIIVIIADDDDNDDDSTNGTR